jgi:septal ring factor EnvC (AmiA/AmiB activator)
VKRSKTLAARISELTEELQRERIESANRLGALEARISALEDEQQQVTEAREQHRDELKQIAQALAMHDSALDSVLDEGLSDPNPAGLPAGQRRHQTPALRSHEGARGR